LNPAVDLLRNVSNLRADMFTFPITIRPDVEHIRMPGLRFDVLGNHFLVLWAVLANHLVSAKRELYILNTRFDGSIKQVARVALLPLLIPGREIMLYNVADHAREGDIARSPRWTELVIKDVIF
jgi:hypothetical protein